VCPPARLFLPAAHQHGRSYMQRLARQHHSARALRPAKFMRRKQKYIGTALFKRHSHLACRLHRITHHKPAIGMKQICRSTHGLNNARFIIGNLQRKHGPRRRAKPRQPCRQRGKIETAIAIHGEKRHSLIGKAMAFEHAGMFHRADRQMRTCTFDLAIMNMRGERQMCRLCTARSEHHMSGLPAHQRSNRHPRLFDKATHRAPLMMHRRRITDPIQRSQHRCTRRSAQWRSGIIVQIGA